MLSRRSSCPGTCSLLSFLIFLKTNLSFFKKLFVTNRQPFNWIVIFHLTRKFLVGICIRLSNERPFSDRWHWPIFTAVGPCLAAADKRPNRCDRSECEYFVWDFYSTCRSILSLRSICRPKMARIVRMVGGWSIGFQRKKFHLNWLNQLAAAFILLWRTFQWRERMFLVRKLRHPSGCYGWFGSGRRKLDRS